MREVQNLQQRQPIVDPNGNASDYFMRYLRERGGVLVDLDALKVDKTLTITTTDGLQGGGDLSADRTFSLTDTGVVAGTYGSTTLIPVITVDAKGRLTSVSTATAGGGVPSTRLINTTNGITGGGDLSADRTLSLTTTGVSAGSYTLASITVDAYGRITAASSGSVSGYVPTTRQVIAGTGLTGGGDLSADRTFNLSNTGVTAGTYGGASSAAVITVDAQGRITSASSVAVSTAIYAPLTNGDPTTPLIMFDALGAVVLVQVA